jgi:hypothetical protein
MILPTAHWLRPSKLLGDELTYLRCATFVYLKSAPVLLLRDPHAYLAGNRHCSDDQVGLPVEEPFV